MRKPSEHSRTLAAGPALKLISGTARPDRVPPAVKLAPLNGDALPKPPAYLSPEARRLWRQTVTEWALDEGMLPVLRAACEAFDRVQAARRILRREPLVVRDRTGRRVAHPAVVIERDARLQFLRAWRQLGLDTEPAGPIGRPPGR
jgi:P27 family predicted phage terminase small subunit